jgi:O-antigen/teichoic acid export membrane protein
MSALMTILQRVGGVMRFRPHDTSTERGRSLERFRRVVLSALASFGARGLGLLSSLVSIPLTFRYLGPERYGLWMVLVSFITAMNVADLGIGNGIMSAIAEANGKDDRELMREYLTSGLGLMMIIAAVLGIAGAFAYPHIPWIRVFNVKSAAVAREGSRAFLVLYTWFVLNIPLNVAHRVQAGLQRSYWSQTLVAAGGVLSLLGLFLVVWLHGSLAWLVFASTIGQIAGLIANGWVLLSGRPWLIPRPRSYSNKAAAKIFHLGILFFVLQCATVLGFTSDNIVIAQVLGAVAVAVYAVPQKLFAIITQLVTIAVLPIWPAYGEAMVRGDYRWVRKAFWTSLRTTVTTAGVLCPVLVIAAPWIIRVAVGKTLHAPLSLLWVLAAWTVITAAWAPVSVLLNGAGVLKIQATAMVISSLANLGLSIYLTRRLGVMGVCLGSITTQIVIMGPVAAYLIHGLFKKMPNQPIGPGDSQPQPALSAE